MLLLPKLNQCQMIINAKQQSASPVRLLSKINRRVYFLFHTHILKMLENRGLVRSRPAHQANPRVAMRRKHDDKLRRRKGAVPKQRSEDGTFGVLL
jgi:hypothetical protein